MFYGFKQFSVRHARGQLCCNRSGNPVHRDAWPARQGALPILGHAVRQAGGCNAHAIMDVKLAWFFVYQVREHL